MTEEQYVRIITERLDAVRNFRASIKAIGYTRQSQMLENVINQIESDTRIIAMKQTIKDEEIERQQKLYSDYMYRAMNGL